MRRFTCLLVVVVGCSARPDPASDRLSPGSEAVAYTEGRPDLAIEFQPADKEEFGKDAVEKPFPFVMPGDKVQVLDDSGLPDTKARLVRVKILKSRFYEGLTERIPRANLRSIPPPR